jgi:hypothetical protein
VPGGRLPEAGGGAGLSAAAWLRGENVVSDSKKWALDRLAEANIIFEPNEVSWKGQLRDLIVWALELALITYLAQRFFS